MTEPKLATTPVADAAAAAAAVAFSSVGNPDVETVTEARGMAAASSTPQKFPPAQTPRKSPPGLTMLGSGSLEDIGSNASGSPLSERSSPGPHNAPCKNRQSAERCVSTSRKIKPIYSRVFTDAEYMMVLGLSAQSDQNRFEEVAEDLKKRSVSLRLNVLVTDNQTASCVTQDSEGQAFLLSAGCKTFLTTAKHNVARETTKSGKIEACQGVSVVTPHKPGYVSGHDVSFGNILGWIAEEGEPFVFPSEANLEPATWKFGHDVQLIELQRNISSTLFKQIDCDKLTRFEAVDPRFKCEVGMTVGILAHSCQCQVAENFCNELMRDQNTGQNEGGALNAGEGGFSPKKGDVFILVGLITHVGEAYIQYEVNTVPGCSGAPVFLLDTSSPDHMKAIAVHSGFLEARGTNFGFLIADELQNRLDAESSHAAQDKHNDEGDELQKHQAEVAPQTLNKARGEEAGKTEKTFLSYLQVWLHGCATTTMVFVLIKPNKNHVDEQVKELQNYLQILLPCALCALMAWCILIKPKQST